MMMDQENLSTDGDRYPGSGRRESHTLLVLPDVFAICRMDGNTSIPAWARGTFVSISRSPQELSIVCPQQYVPAQVPSERGWRCLAFAGPLHFDMTGVIAHLSGILASRNVSLFVISTFDTDYVLIRRQQLAETMEALRAAGYRIREQSGTDVAFGEQPQ